MRCNNGNHVYSWVRTDGVIDPLPPEGTACLCGLATFHERVAAPVMVGMGQREGLCVKCGRPVDDHLHGEPCA